MRCPTKWKLLKDGFLMCRKGFSTLALDILSRIVFCCCCEGWCPVHFMMFSNIPGLYTLNTSGNCLPTPPTQQLWQPKISRYFQVSTWRKTCPHWEPITWEIWVGHWQCLLPSPSYKKAPSQFNVWVWLIIKSLLWDVLEWPAKRFGPNFYFHLDSTIYRMCWAS